MNIHEYQAKELLKSYGVPVPAGGIAYSDTQAAQIAEQLGGERWVVKAQIHAGGRGKAGGVRVVGSVDEVRAAADRLIGTRLVTHQTGPEGTLVKRVWVEQASHVHREYYLGFAIDRTTQRITLIASGEGGMDIEDVHRASPTRSSRKPSIRPLASWISSAARSPPASA